MSEIDRIVSLLGSESMEIQLAATIVLGELRPKSAAVTKALLGLLDHPVPVVQQHAAQALAKTGAAVRAAPRLFELLGASSADLRRAAADAIVSIGPDIVPTIRARQAEASAEQKRALDAILVELGGKDAFGTLLAGLAASTGEAAKAAAIAVRQKVRAASGRERKSYLAATVKFLESMSPGSRGRGKGKAGKGGGATLSAADEESRTAARAAAVKILGYLEDPSALDTLIGHAAAPDEAPSVRQEALLALRFVLNNHKAPAKLVEALVAASEAPDRTLAQTALHTLGALPLAPGMATRLGKLLGHVDLDRVRFVAEYLKQQSDAEATRELVRALGRVDRRRAEIAADALRGRDDAVAPLARALLETEDPDRSWLLRSVLRAASKKVTAAVSRELLETALERLAKTGRGWEALLDVARDANAEAVCEGLRSLGRKLARSGDRERELQVLDLVCRCEGASDDDRYRLAARSLAPKAGATSAAAQSNDPALERFTALVARGFDLPAALRKDQSIGLEQLYYVGFFFAERRHPIGTEILEIVAERGGRSKLGKMAKNKLALSGGGSD